MWLRQLLAEIGYGQKEPTVLHEDNAGCIFIANNANSSVKTKHIGIQVHFVRECVKSQEVRMVKVASAFNLADFLTKALGRIAFLRNAGKVVKEVSHEGTNILSKSG